VNPVRKLIISISIALVLFSGAYFLLEEDIVKLKRGRIRDIVGQNVEDAYFEKTDVMIFGIQRFIGITVKKLDFFIKNADLGGLLEKNPDKKAQLIINDFVNTDPYCKRVRIVNSGLEILFSTSQSDVYRSKLNAGIYGSLFSELPPSVSRVLVDPIVERIIFHKTFTRKDEQYAILFYYSQDALDGVFSQVEGLDYKGFLITTDKIVLVNFPEIDASEERNLSDLVKVVRQNNTGALRLLLKGFDKTLYYKRFTGQYTDWTVGLTLDTEHLRISRIGMLVLIIQALVVASVLIFIVFSLHRKKGLPPASEARRERLAGVDEEEARAPGHGGSLIPSAASPVPTGVERGGAETEGGATPTPPLEPEETAFEAEPVETGVMALSDIEELVNVEEIGEAEVAGEGEEVGGSYVMVEEEQQGGLEEPEELVELEEYTEAGDLREVEDAQEVEELLGGAGGTTVRNETVVEGGLGIEELEIVDEAQEALKPAELEEVSAAEELAALLSEGKGTGAGEREAGFPESLPEVVDDLQEVEAFTGYPGSETSGAVPSLENLVKAGERSGAGNGPAMSVLEQAAAEEEAASGEEGTLQTIPEEVFRAKQGERRNDELSELITTIEGGEREGEQEDPAVIFKKSLKAMGLSKAALLIADDSGRCSPKTMFGLNKKTAGKLSFDGSENIYTQFLSKGKTLYIREKVFKSKEVSKKFDRTDSSKIQTLVFSPILQTGNVRGILVAGTSKGKKIDHEKIIKEIKTIKEVLLKLIEPDFP
jgi:hypothetical protein